MTLLSQALLLLAAVGAAQTDPAPVHLAAVGDNPPAICAFAEEAGKEFGEPGAKAAAFLVAGMPARDLRSLGKDFLLENLRLAFLARQSFPWSKQVPDDLFLDCVLPYAQLDEPRDPWRREFYDTCSDIVKGCKTATEAAHQLNSTLFNRLGVKYSTNRKRPIFSLSRFAFVAPSLAQHQKTRTVSELLLGAFRSHHHPKLGRCPWTA